MRKTEHRYQVGEIVNETLKIVSQTTVPKGKHKRKAYEVQSIVYPDAPTYTIVEGNLSHSKQGCAYTTGRRIYEGNSIYSIERLRPYLVDIEEAKTIAPKSNKKYKFKCPECNTIKSISPNTLNYYGFSCPKCSKGTSYPELFMMAYLEVKGIEYEYQKVFDDLPNRRFDFYLPKENKVVETHGEQHYKKEQSLFSYKNTVMSDKEKENYCEENCIGFVEIDSRKSDFKYIKNSINSSILPNIVGREERGILKHIELNKRYPVKKIITLYQEGKSCSYISNKLGLSITIIQSILYKNSISIRNNKYKRASMPVKDIISSYQAGNSINKVGNIYNINTKTVSRILKENNITIRPTGSHMVGKVINNKPIRCINTGEVFYSIKEASKWLGKTDKGLITRVCRGEGNTAYKHPITGEKLTWEYVD